MLDPAKWSKTQKLEIYLSHVRDKSLGTTDFTYIYILRLCECVR